MEEEKYIKRMQGSIMTLNDPVGPLLTKSILASLVQDCEMLLLQLLRRHTSACASLALANGDDIPVLSRGPMDPKIDILADNGVRITLAHLLPDNDYKDGRTSKTLEQLWAELYYQPIAQALVRYTPSERMVIWYVHAYSQATPWSRIPDNDRYKTRPFTNILTRCAGIDDNPDRLAMTLSSSRRAQPDEEEHTEIFLLPYDKDLSAVTRELSRQQPVRFGTAALSSTQ